LIKAAAQAAATQAEAEVQAANKRLRLRRILKSRKSTSKTIFNQ
jgi:hypothetical protein